MRKKVYWGSIFLLLFFLFFALAPSIAHATGWVSETVGQEQAVFNFEKYPLENYSLDFFVDSSWKWLPWKWGEGIGDAVIYGLYAITNVLWLLNVYISYFIGFIVQEAFDLDFITSLVSSLATNMQRIAGIDANGLRATGLFPVYGKWLVLIAGCYIAYVGAVKRQATRAIQHAVLFGVTFIMSGVFLMNANTYLTQVNDAQKDINSEMLVIAKDIIPNASSETIVVAPGHPSEAEQKTKGATNAIRENLFELQVSTPWRLLQFGDNDISTIGEDRVNDILSQQQFAKNSDREKNVKKEVSEKNNMNMSVKGAFLRFGMTLLVIVANAVVSYSVAVLTITMITSQILFLLFCAFLPVAMIFSLFPNSNRILFGAMQKVAQALMTKMGITLILAVVFSLSHSFFGLAQEKGYIWVIFLQIATWLTTVNKVNELLGFMSLGGADTRQGGRFGRMAKSLLFAGVARNMMKRTMPQQATKPKQHAPKRMDMREKQPISKRVGEKISNVQDMPNRFVEKANTMKDTVKNAPTNAKYKAMEMRNSYDDGRIGTEMKNNNQRSNRVAQRQLAQQQRVDALRQAEERKKNNVRNHLSSTAPQSFDQTKLPKEKNALRPTISQSDKKHRVSVPVTKASYDSNTSVPTVDQELSKASYSVLGMDEKENREPTVPIYFTNDSQGKEQVEQFNQKKQETRLKRQANKLGLKEEKQVQRFVQHKQNRKHVPRGGKK